MFCLGELNSYIIIIIIGVLFKCIYSFVTIIIEYKRLDILLSKCRNVFKLGFASVAILTMSI